jgi:hypothetical protein
MERVAKERESRVYLVMIAEVNKWGAHFESGCLGGGGYKTKKKKHPTAGLEKRK